MPTQKRGFWLFIFSLIPGAGEMYMGFFKQGISIMTLFWGIVAISGRMNLDFTVVFLPVLQFLPCTQSEESASGGILYSRRQLYFPH